MTSDSSPVWFITGCSTGLGRALAEAVLARGWRAAVTARRRADIAGLAGERALLLELDVADPAAIAAAVAAAEARFGAIDVLVNNAGYGYLTSAEEGEDKEIRALFEANVFGLFALTRAVLPGMRARRRGHIINITSIAGYLGNIASGYYAATKHAVEGFTDSLAAEVAPLGIKVSGVAPGPFRTDWGGRSLHTNPPRLADYAGTVATRLKAIADRGKTQPGDPVRAAQAMIHLTEVDNPPRHFVLGAIGFNAITTKLKTALAEIEAWREATLGTDFPKE
jgi:NAD(P)-dependent dehydrogenase (short-subunit alcohol dehydrogenase family)